MIDILSIRTIWTPFSSGSSGGGGGGDFGGLLRGYRNVRASRWFRSRR